MILLDTSGLLAWIDGRQSDHERVAHAMKSAAPPYFLSPFILAELDYLLSTKVGFKAECSFLDEVSRGVYRLESFAASDNAELWPSWSSSRTWTSVSPMPRSSSLRSDIALLTF